MKIQNHIEKTRGAVRILLEFEPRQAMLLLAAAASRTKPYAPAVTPTEALVITTAVTDYRLAHSYAMQPQEELVHMVRWSVRDYHGEQSCLHDPTFEARLQSLGEHSALTLVTQAVYFSTARQVAHDNADLAVSPDDFFTLRGHTHAPATSEQADF